VHVVVDDMHVVGSASARHPATRLEGDPGARVSLSSALLSAARSYWRNRVSLGGNGRLLPARQVPA
jgi:hypothetical protein